MSNLDGNGSLDAVKQLIKAQSFKSTNDMALVTHTNIIIGTTSNSGTVKLVWDESGTWWQIDGANTNGSLSENLIAILEGASGTLEWYFKHLLELVIKAPSVVWTPIATSALVTITVRWEVSIDDGTTWEVIGAFSDTMDGAFTIVFDVTEKVVQLSEVSGAVKVRVSVQYDITTPVVGIQNPDMPLEFTTEVRLSTQ